MLKHLPIMHASLLKESTYYTQNAWVPVVLKTCWCAHQNIDITEIGESDDNHEVYNDEKVT